MTVTLTGDPGTVDVPGISPYPNPMDILTDATQLPKDPAKLPGDTVIGIPVWAHLQGVSTATVHRNRVKADARRGTPEARPGDMPKEDGKFGNSPYWTMATYRAWEASRPGKGAGAGRPAGSGKGRAVRVRLPAACPHCRQQITAEDIARAEAAGSGQPGQPGRAG